MLLTRLNSIVKVNNLFSGLNPESEEPEDKSFQVEMNPNLEEIVKGFEKLLKDNISKPWDYIYNQSLDLIKNSYSSKNISNFVILSKKFESYRYFKVSLGYFLSVLINKSNDLEFKLNTKHLEKYPAYLGYKNNGKIIIVNGSVDSCVGDSMIDGNININGYAGLYVGTGLIGGTIHLNGEYECLTKWFYGGNIFHKGIQIVKDGKIDPNIPVITYLDYKLMNFDL
jgi:hypothetical protein